jgi:hypothetical protein
LKKVEEVEGVEEVERVEESLLGGLASVLKTLEKFL